MPEETKIAKIPSVKPLLAGTLLLLVILGLVFFIIDPLKPNKRKPINKTLLPTPISNNINPLMKVGAETLYQQDLDTELAYHPQRNDPQTRTLLINKIINDSVILQGGQTDGLIKTTPEIYNAVNKNYLKRVRAVEEVKNNFAKQSNRIEGAFVSVWFYNNNKVGALGYDKGKELAYRKIKEVYDAVKNNQITIKQAGDKIKHDTSLKQIDESYDVNAYSQFVKTPDQRITYFREFDKVIRRLSAGELTPITLLKDKDETTGEMKDALYMFAQVTNRIDSGQYSNFEDWLIFKKKGYEVTYF